MVQYHGTWYSTVYPYVMCRGNVTVNLPAVIESKYTTEATIAYRGMYRLGSVERIPITVSAEGTAESKDFVTPSVAVPGTALGQPVEAPSGVGQLTFKILRQSTGHVSVQGPLEIEGSYSLSNPVDEGVFQLKRGSAPPEQCDIQ